MTEVMYAKELVKFEPKIKSMVHNFRQCGYRFDGHEDSDLLQELFLKSLEIRSLYDSKKAALRTWWYACHRSRLVTLADNGKKGMLWTLIDDCGDLDILDPVFIEPNIWRSRAMGAVSKMMDSLWATDHYMATVCEGLIEFEGDKLAVSVELGMPVVEIDYMLTKLRNWKPAVVVLDCIPF